MTVKKMRAKDVAYTYGIGLSTVWHYVKEGLLIPYKISPRVTVFDVEEVEKFFSGTVEILTMIKTPSWEK